MPLEVARVTASGPTTAEQTSITVVPLRRLTGKRPASEAGLVPGEVRRALRDPGEEEPLAIERPRADSSEDTTERGIEHPVVADNPLENMQLLRQIADRHDPRTATDDDRHRLRSRSSRRDHAALWCQIEAVDLQQVTDQQDDAWSISALLAGSFQAKVRKELSMKDASPQLRQQVHEAKETELTLLIQKGAIRILKGTEAKAVRHHHLDRFMLGRFVVTRKQEEENARIKARRCLKGYLDPDLPQLIASSKLQSPTITPYGRNVCLQLIASHLRDLQFGDVKCAFPEAGHIERAQRLFSPAPAGVLGLTSGDVLEVVGNVCFKE